MQDMFKGNVSMQDSHTQIMSSCKTLQFRKTYLLSLVGRHDLLKDMSSCLKMHFYCFYFLCFILLKTWLFPRHVLNMASRQDFYSVRSIPNVPLPRKDKQIKLLTQISKRSTVQPCIIQIAFSTIFSLETWKISSA